MRYWVVGFIALSGLFWLIFQRDNDHIPSSVTEEPAIRRDANVPLKPARPSGIEKVQQLSAVPVVRADQMVPAEGSAPSSKIEVVTIKGRDQEIKLVQLLLKRPDGNLIKEDYGSAARACAEKGMRLPTIRELANLAKARGATGILNFSSGNDQAQADQEIEQIRAINPDGKEDEFKYSYNGFQPDSNRQNIPEDSGDGGFWLQGKWLWSSSRALNCPLAEPAKFCAYIFDAESGEISSKYDTVHLSASCVKEAP